MSHAGALNLGAFPGVGSHEITTCNDNNNVEDSTALPAMEFPPGCVGLCGGQTVKKSRTSNGICTSKASPQRKL